MTDFWVGLYLAALVSLFFTATVRRALGWYGVNSLMLGAVALSAGWTVHDEALIVTGVITLLLKGLVIPAVLVRAVARVGLRRYLKPVVPLQFNMVLIPAVLVGSWYLFAPLQADFGVHARYMAVAVAAMLLALLFMVEQRHVAAKIVGFLMLENSLFLLATLATGGMPMLVELGIFFDLMMAVVVINVLLRAEVRG